MFPPKKTPSSKSPGAQSVELNRQMHLAIKGGRSQAFLTEHRKELSQKQIALLSASSTAQPASAPAAGTSPASSESMKAYVDRRLKQALSQIPMRAPIDPRSHPGYNQLYASLGAPRWMPKPLPFYAGLPNATRYAYTRGRSNPTIYSLPAGETALVSIRPYDYASPVLLEYTTGGGTGRLATGINWDPTTGTQDQPAPTLVVYAAWSGTNPFTFMEDSNAVKDAVTGTMKLLSTSVSHPPLCQLMGGTMRINVVCPTNAAAVCWAADSGTAPSVFGRGAHYVRHHLENTTGGGYAGLDPALIGGVRIIAYKSDVPVQPRNIVKAYAQPVLLAGGGNESSWHHVHHMSPDAHWQFVGNLDSTDGPASGWNSTRNGMMPRDNVVANASYGMWLIENTSSTTITIEAGFEAVYCQLLPSDDTITVVGTTAHAMRHQAPCLAEHKPDARIPVGVSVTGTAKAEMPAKLAEHHRANGVPTDVARAAAIEAHVVKTAEPSWTHKVSSDVADVAAAYGMVKKSGLGSDLKKAANSLWSWLTKAEEAVVTSTGPSIALVEEASPLLLM